VAAILWDPYQKKAVATMQTGHTGNIFSVKVSWSENKAPPSHKILCPIKYNFPIIIRRS